MRTKLRKIGNSYGVIISKQLLEQAAVEDEVHLSVQDSRIIIDIKKNPRDSGEEILLKAGSLEDEDLPENLSNDFDEKEWTW
ncbi:MAG: AbrB/MazE/SpoVT family DNA-binding domain-containing protein [Chryseobacterium sp.]|nr:MAG: AbrB/MazE/SpoVT family DNA-binding domain-containing protein [Chryseobacterium sp.]